MRLLAVDDEFVHYVLPDLIYVRQKSIFDYLFGLIESDVMGCSTGYGTRKVPCACRIVEAVAPHVVDFPVEVRVSGDLKVDDYPKALEEVRSWIRKHREDYELRTDIY